MWNVILQPANLEQRNQRNVLIDGVGMGLATGIGTFLSVFLVRLGASNFLVGLLTAMPAFTGMLLALPIGEFLARQRHIIPWFSKARLLALSCYAVTGLVPFLVRSHQPEAVIVIWALATLPQTVVSVSFTVVMGAVAGPRGRFTLMSRRWSIVGITTSLTVLGAGQLLESFPFPFNYQIIFIGSAIASLISYAFSSSIVLPPVETPFQPAPIFDTLRRYGGTLRANKRFVQYTVSRFVFAWGMALAVPLFPIYWVRQVGASDVSISAIYSVQTAVSMVAYYLWARASQRRGVRFVLIASTIALSFYPLGTALTTSVEVLIILSGVAGFMAAGMDLALFDVLLSTCPADDQAAYIGMQQTTVFIASFLAPLLGTAIVDTVGIVPALAAGTALRLGGSVLMLLMKVGKE